MIDLNALQSSLEALGMGNGVPILLERIHTALNRNTHRDLPNWLALLRSLPDLSVLEVGLNEDRVRVESAVPLDARQHAQLHATLQKFHPWRKGPFQIHSIQIDSEWRSDLKWNRLNHAIAPLEGRRVLDVGCGNGYHCWRMLGAGAKLVIGIDPTLLSVVQFWAIRHFAGALPVFVLPLCAEEFPIGACEFDTVFSMGVLYHRKSPLDHLSELHAFLRPGGELVLETLVVEGAEGHVLLPEERYAMMRNVWFIPSCATLCVWLKRCGFENMRVIDVSLTSTAEQRATEWMRFHSLADFLDPANPRLTREGLPAPQRAIVVANKPASGRR